MTATRFQLVEIRFFATPEEADADGMRRHLEALEQSRARAVGVKTTELVDHAASYWAPVNPPSTDIQAAANPHLDATCAPRCECACHAAPAHCEPWGIRFYATNEEADADGMRRHLEALEQSRARAVGVKTTELVDHAATYWAPVNPPSTDIQAAANPHLDTTCAPRCECACHKQTIHRQPVKIRFYSTPEEADADGMRRHLEALDRQPR